MVIALPTYIIYPPAYLSYTLFLLSPFTACISPALAKSPPLQESSLQSEVGQAILASPSLASIGFG